jgi:hypothetical protein
MTGPENIGVRVEPNFGGFAFGPMGHPEEPYVNNLMPISRMKLFIIAQLSRFLRFAQSQLPQ